ncbi:hypothetical protein OSTOST_18892 [Ostertagia ostertagi]
MPHLSVNDVEGMLEQNAQKKSRSPSLASLRNGSVSPNRTGKFVLAHVLGDWLCGCRSDSVWSHPNRSLKPLPYRARRHTATADELLYPAENSEPISPKEPEAAKPELPPDEEKKEKKPRVDAASLLLLPSSSNMPPPTAGSTTDSARHSRKFRNTIANLPPRPLRCGQLPARPTTLNCQGNLGSRMLSSSRLPSLAEVPVGGEDAPTSSVRERAGADHSTRTTKSVFARLIPWTTEASPSTLLNRSDLLSLMICVILRGFHFLKTSCLSVQS